MAANRLVEALANHLAIAHHQRPDRHFALLRRLAGQLQGLAQAVRARRARQPSA